MIQTKMEVKSSNGLGNNSPRRNGGSGCLWIILVIIAMIILGYYTIY